MYCPGGALLSSDGKSSRPYGVPKALYAPSAVNTSRQRSRSCSFFAENAM